MEKILLVVFTIAGINAILGLFHTVTSKLIPNDQKQFVNHDGQNQVYLEVCCNSETHCKPFKMHIPKINTLNRSEKLDQAIITPDKNHDAGWKAVNPVNHEPVNRKRLTVNQSVKFA